ncbi:YdiU family protein [Comamonas testosteroni]|uniref:Protein nucleotidyltransferase YdiU n=1 Tax=Comamonas testosteroni TaxID=285 RepID=A0A373FME2_COMTE|nr:YdiU family protein [Comamonas testosteroni]RGE45334.1 YdiU family protein [Comamonas testosteroni]
MSESPAKSISPHWLKPGRFEALGPAFFTYLQPTPVPQPHRVATSASTAQWMQLDADWLASDEALQVLSGNAVDEGSRPLATVYSGHQFGVWAGQLGDGRAIMLGETAQGFEVQLKGAGRTPYSRGGDGRAVLRSSIREFLCSEAMAALGIPTTRALALTGSPLPVARETMETAAIVTRVAPSFVRFGHFEHFAARDMQTELKALADLVIGQHYPECRTATSLAGNAYANFLQAVSERTARLLARWQAVGFCHGVMNTDNMSILGLTIDYGPFQFLDAFDPGHICNHSDSQGRYAFNRQPQVAYWNLYCLGQALLPLIGDEELTIAALESYKSVFPAAYAQQMLAKLGLPENEADTPATEGRFALLVNPLLQILTDNKVDYTIFFTRLTDAVAQAKDGKPDFEANVEPLRDIILDRASFDAWALTYSEQLAQVDYGQAAHLMQKSNPRFVLRNHLGETVIRAAEAGDFAPVQQMLAVLQTPFDSHPDHADWAGFPPDWASSIEISCSS